MCPTGPKKRLPREKTAAKPLRALELEIAQSEQGHPQISCVLLLPFGRLPAFQFPGDDMRSNLRDTVADAQCTDGEILVNVQVLDNEGVRKI